MSHTDSRADHKHNDALSQKRAQSVVDYLIEEGIEGERLSAKGYGKHKPKYSDAKIKKMKTEEEKEVAHQENRRTDFEVLRTDYIPKNKRGEVESPPKEDDTENKPDNPGDN